MTFRFWRRFKITPGVHVNVSKSGLSLSIGPRGAKLTVGPGGYRATLGLPGTGLHWTKVLPRDQPDSSSPSQIDGGPLAAETSPLPQGSPGGSTPPDSAPEQVIPIGLDRGLAALDRGDEVEAIEYLRTCTDTSDGAFLCGILVLKSEGNVDEAIAHLSSAVRGDGELGRLFLAMHREVSVRVAITDDAEVDLRPDRLGATLALVEALQRAGRVDAAMRHLAELQIEFPMDELVRLSVDDLLAVATP